MAETVATARKWRPALFRQPEVAAAADAPPRSLASALAETFEDGTTSGARTAAQYRRLCATVGRIIETDHHALAVRLQEAYRRHDPSAAPDAARRRGGAPAFKAPPHGVLDLIDVYFSLLFANATHVLDAETAEVLSAAKSCLQYSKKFV